MSQSAPFPVKALLLRDDGATPNNPRLPVLHYPRVLSGGRDLVERFEALFDGNGWPAAWRNGIHGFHHFHSTAHEALGIYAGVVSVLLGGESGVEVELEPGDAVVLPAGVGHKQIRCRGRLGVVGAYPLGQSPDLCRPDPARLSARAAAVAAVPLPGADPLFGPAGPLTRHWAS